MIEVGVSFCGFEERNWIELPYLLVLRFRKLALAINILTASFHKFKNEHPFFIDVPAAAQKVRLRLFESPRILSLCVCFIFLQVTSNQKSEIQ